MKLFGYEWGLKIKPIETAADLVRQSQAQRGLIFGPYKATSEQLASMVFGGSGTSSGAHVTEAGSLSIAAVFACVRVISESIASLPFKIYKREAGNVRRPAPEHPIYDLLQVQSNDLMTAMKYRELILVHLLLWGNHYSEKQFNGAGDVVALWPIHPGRVKPEITIREGSPQLIFKVQKDTGPQITLSQEQVFFVPGLGTGTVGKSPIQLHREGLGITVQAEKYGARFFKNDARPSLVLEHPLIMGDEAHANFKKDWNETYGGAENANKVAILEEGMTAKQVGLPPGDAQFMETRKYQRNEVASIYRVPPHMIGDLERATFSNIEQQSIDFVVHTLRPWFTRIEQAVNMQLLAPAERPRFYSSHVVEALLRGDISSRYTAYATARQWGWMSVNDIRELENQNPTENGDIYLQPLNMIEAGSQGVGSRAMPAPQLGNDGLPGNAGQVEMRALPPRLSAADMLKPVYLDIFTRIVKREIAEIKGAVKRYLAKGDADGFLDWVALFAEEHAQWMAPRLLPAFEAMAETMIANATDEIGGDLTADDLGDFIANYTEAAANRHAGNAAGQVAALIGNEDPEGAVLERLDEWNETRADKLARREKERSSNAITKAIWATAGVLSITWRTVGKSCPICNEMDGRTTLIHAPFLGAGEDIAGLVTSGSVGHPPIHDGCDCYLMPNVGRSLAPGQAGKLENIFKQIIEHDGVVIHGKA